jgi:glutathione S-transferase
MADITAICVVDFAGWIKLSVPEDYAGLQRWRAALRERPSMAL